MNPSCFPGQAGDLQNYGTAKLDDLLQLFTPLIDTDRAKSHFLMYKHFARSYNSLPFDRFAKILINDFTDEYPDFATLAKIALIIPVSLPLVKEAFLYKLF